MRDERHEPLRSWAALRLRRSGWRPLILERAGAPLGRYFIGLFPTGIKAAGRLGVLAAIGDRAPTAPAAIAQDEPGVEVSLTTTERFDLVVGADGLRRMAMSSRGRDAPDQPQVSCCSSA